MKCLLKKANYILKLTRGISLTMFTEVTCPKDLARELHVGTLYFPSFRSKDMWINEQLCVQRHLHTSPVLKIWPGNCTWVLSTFPPLEVKVCESMNSCVCRGIFIPTSVFDDDWSCLVSWFPYPLLMQLSAPEQ